MNIDFEKYNQIENYLNGSLKGDALGSFESELSNNLDLRNEVEFHKIANEIIVDDSLADVKSRLNQMHKKPFPWKTISAFVIPLLAGTFILLNQGGEVNTKNEQEALSIPSVYSEQYINNRVAEKATEEKALDGEIELGKLPSSQLEEKTVVINSVPDPIVENQKTTVELHSTTEETIKAVDKESIAKTFSCEDVSISASLLIENTCAGMENGIVKLETATVTGGEGPYEYSVLSSKTRIKKKEIPFETANTFNGLAQGYYSVFIKDKNGCISYSPKAAYVNASICQEDIDGISLNTAEHESWFFENKEGVSGTLKITNGNGDVEFEKPFNDTTQLRWFGKNDKDEYLSGGVYSFELEFDNGKKQKGELNVK